MLWLWYGRRPHLAVSQNLLDEARPRGQRYWVLIVHRSVRDHAHALQEVERTPGQLLVIAIWKLSTSMLNALMGLFVAWLTVGRNSDAMMVFCK